MPDLHLEVLSITQALETTPDGIEQYVHELLFFPDTRLLGNDPDVLPSVSRSLAREWLGRRPLEDVHRRQPPAEVSLSQVILRLEPFKGPSASWRHEVELTLPLVRWREGKDQTVAYLPVPGIEVIAGEGQDLIELIDDQVRFALKRKGLGQSLLTLAWLQRGGPLRLERLAWNAQPQTPVERYVRLWGRECKRPDVLREVALQMKPELMPRAYEREEEVKRLGGLLSRKRKSSLLLVGASGSGKTAVIKELIRRWDAFGLAGKRVWQSSGGRLVAGQTGFGMWQERCQQVIRQLRESGDVIYLGNLFELMEVGKSMGSSESIAAFFRPSIMRGEIAVLVECTPEQLGWIETHDPRVLDGLRQVRLEEPDSEKGRRILERVAAEEAAGDRCVTWSAEALDGLDRLHRRYTTLCAYPGRAVRFLKRVTGEADAGSAVEPGLVMATFSRETGLPSWLLNDAEPFERHEVKRWFAERVRFQDRAIEGVVDTLALVKARLARPGKPLASFIFTGPTGVGKTELAKTLAEYLFQTKEKLVRFDMSEFSDPSSAHRLVSDGSEKDEGILTAAVRDQPFSVILLDEFEKATPSIYDLFLQVLGEGRLTDGGGRLADFTNAIIIITSNLGARSFQRGELGFGANSVDTDRRRAISHFEKAIREAVKPEFFNRIDGMIPFLPLTRQAVADIARRELDLAARREGLADRRLSLEIHPELLADVIEDGFDARYGARPLKRVLERRILLPVSGYLNRNPRSRGTLNVSLGRNGASRVAFIPADASIGQGEQAMRRLHEMIEKAADQRRKLERLKNGSLCIELENERNRILRAKDLEKKRLARKLRNRENYIPFDKERESRLKHLGGLLDQAAERLDVARRSEESLLLELYECDEGRLPSAESADWGSPIADDDYRPLLIDLYVAAMRPSKQLVLRMESDHEDWLTRMARTYYLAMRELWDVRCRIGVFYRKPSPDCLKMTSEKPGETFVIPRLFGPADLETTFFGNIPRGIGALALEFEGVPAVLRLAHEGGTHVWESEDQERRRCLVETLADSLGNLEVPLRDLERGREFKAGVVRRHFDDRQGMYRDAVLERKASGRFSVELIATVLEDTLIQKVEEAL